MSSFLLKEMETKISMHTILLSNNGPCLVNDTSSPFLLLILFVVEHPINDPRESPLRDHLRTPAIFRHLEELYAIALKHNNSRSVTNGYLASAEYVQAQLTAKAGRYCDISTQEFRVPVWSELAVPELSSTGIGHESNQITYQNKVDFQSTFFFICSLFL